MSMIELLGFLMGFFFRTAQQKLAGEPVTGLRRHECSEMQKSRATG